MVLNKTLRYGKMWQLLIIWITFFRWHYICLKLLTVCNKDIRKYSVFSSFTMFLLQYFKCSVWKCISAWHWKVFGKIQNKTQWQKSRIITCLLEFNIYWLFIVIAVTVLKGSYETGKHLGEECCSARKILIIKAISQKQITEEMFVWILFCRILVALKMSSVSYLVSFKNSLPSSLWC